MLSLGRNKQRSCKKNRASTVHGLSSSGRYQLNLRFGLLFRVIDCITIFFFASASSWGTQSHRNAALERRDHWDTGTNPPRQVIIVWLIILGTGSGREEGWRGGGRGGGALMPAFPPLFYDNAASWTSLISTTPNIVSFWSFPTVWRIPLPDWALKSCIPSRDFENSRITHCILVKSGITRMPFSLSFRPSGKFDLSIKRSRNFLNDFFNGLQKWLSNLSFRIIPSWVVLVPLNYQFLQTWSWNNSYWHCCS